MRRFYSSNIKNNQTEVLLNNEETRHLRDVLRLREGENVQVFDGVGKEFLCEIETIGKKETKLKVIEEISPSAPESDLDLTLAVAFLKGEKFEFVIQKAVELGVKTFVPIITKRTYVKLKETDKKLERWRKIILEASKQCGRAKLMEIESPVNLETLIKNTDSSMVLFSEKNGESFSKIKSSKKITAYFGSEGGWDDSEIEFAKANGVEIITLKGRILRAETAVVTISALLQNHFGDLI